jgi:serine/threonine protein kinase
MLLIKLTAPGLCIATSKPGNVMLTRTGAKLMDFGLAKPTGLAAAAGGSGSALLLSAAPTLNTASPQLSPLTMQGTIVGTIQYMSPEQIEGKEADTRSDIFAIGAVLFEMVTGKRAFEGKSQISIASAILEKEPERISATKPGHPTVLDHIVQCSLKKNRDERLASAHDLKLQLEWAAEQGPQETVAAGKQWSLLAWVVLAGLAVEYALCLHLGSRRWSPCSRK